MACRATRVLAGLLLVVFTGVPCWGQEIAGWYQRPRSYAPTLRHYIAAPPGADFYPQYAAPGPVSAVPAFQWGYFGARSKPYAYNHSGFYGDTSTTIAPRGY